MNTFCKHSLLGGGKNKPVHLFTKGTVLSLLLISACTTFTACNESENAIPQMASNRLNISVGIHQPQSRAGLITSATLPEASEIGIKLEGYDDADNIKFTAATQDSKQVWNPASDIVLDETKGTLYAYYPWKSGTDLSAISVETASQTDYLYAEPVANVSEKNANVPVTMKHMLANVKIAINKGTYVGTGNISKIAIQSDGFATAGTFNAAQETPGFVADSYTGVGDVITNTTATTLGGNAIDIMVVSNDAEKPITIAATIDGVEYTATTTAVELAKGNSYQYTLTLNSTFMSVSKVTVTPWNNVPKEDDLILEECSPWTNISNGVYAVSADRKPVELPQADESCIAVALITNNQKIMIYKTDVTNSTGGVKYYWGMKLYQKDVAGITEITDKSVAEADFNGKANTAAIIAAYSEHSVDMVDNDMCKGLETLNSGSNGKNNQGYNDWYIPAAGQLWEMYTKKSVINGALTQIGGSYFVDNDNYWSSSEYDSSDAWYVKFYSTGTMSESYKFKSGGGNRVRFVRDIN